MAERVQHVMHALNAVFLISGLIVLGITIVGQVKLQVANSLIAGTTHANAPAILFTISACLSIAFLVIYLFFCGIIRENPFLTKVFITLIAGILALQLIFSVWAHVAAESQSNRQELVDAVTDRFAKYVNSVDYTIVDTSQEYYKCCGVSSYKEYTKIPGTCCGQEKDQFCDIKNVYGSSCKDEIADTADNFLKALAICGYTVTIIEVLSVILVLYLMIKHL